LFCLVIDLKKKRLEMKDLGDGGMTQAVTSLLRKHEALTSNHSTAKKKD
jgi:hypothetical protein